MPKQTISTILATRPAWQLRYNLGARLGQLGRGPGGESFPIILPDWPVATNPRLKSRHGQASARDGGRIELHPYVLATDHWESEETFFHELAHLIADHLGARDAHGSVWQWVFNCFGFHPRRCATHRASDLFLAGDLDLDNLD